MKFPNARNIATLVEQSEHADASRNDLCHQAVRSAYLEIILEVLRSSKQDGGILIRGSILDEVVDAINKAL